MWVLLKYHKNLFLKNGLLYQEVLLKNHQGPISQFVNPKHFVCKVILTCHDDKGHLGMERTLGLLQEKFVWPKMADDVHIHICNAIDALGLKSHRKDLRHNQYWFHIPLELGHLDSLTVGGRADDNRSANILIVTDHFTKYAQAYVTLKQTVPVVTGTLWENF